MLEFKMADGSVWLINHLISFLVSIGAMIYLCFKAPTQKDKVLHVLISVGVTAVIIALFNLLSIKQYWWIAPIVGMLVGLGKEMWDLINPKKKKFDWRDILADVIGVVWVSTVYFMSF